MPQAEQAAEYLMMSLRLDEGLDLARYHALSGAALDPQACARLADMGMVIQSGERLVATQNGRMVLNSVVRDLLPDPT